MPSKMQLRSVGEVCPGYTQVDDVLWELVSSDMENETSCETCIHWQNNECDINLFDRVLTSLDQT